MRTSKWIGDTSPEQRADDVARRAIEARLQAVCHYLPLAAAGPIGEVEPVHQLRVATRRAMAALEIFDPLLPSARTAWLTKQLKRVRRAAGAARDLDVLIRRLRGLDEEHPQGPYAVLLASAQQLREQAQQPIVAIHERLARKELSHRVAMVLKRVRLRCTADRIKKLTFGQAARKEMRPLVDDFFSAAAADLSDYESLHALRIEGKRLRYAMEIFAGAFDPSFRKSLYPLVAALQEKLGEVNDHCAALKMLGDRPNLSQSADLAAPLAAVSTRERTELEASRQRFFEWWNADRCEDLAARFEAALHDSSNGR